MSIQACAVCGRVLDRIGDKWIHAIQYMGFEDDHLAVPVDYELISVTKVCDFCHEEVPSTAVMTIPAEAFDTNMGTRSMGNWVACSSCAMLILTEDWTEVIERAIAGLLMEVRRLGLSDMSDVDVKEAKVAVGVMYDMLQKHMTGRPRPWQVGDQEDL